MAKEQPPRRLPIRGLEGDVIVLKSPYKALGCGQPEIKNMTLDQFKSVVGTSLKVSINYCPRI
jgi:hypothetical protein